MRRLRKKLGLKTNPPSRDREAKKKKKDRVQSPLLIVGLSKADESRTQITLAGFSVILSLTFFFHFRRVFIIVKKMIRFRK